MTADEFERAYAERSQRTIEQIRALGRIMRPCRCREEGCEGWQSVSRTFAEQQDREFPMWDGREHE